MVAANTIFIDSSIKVTTSISLISKRFTAGFLAQGKEKNDVLEILKRSSLDCQFPHAWHKGPLALLEHPAVLIGAFFSTALDFQTVTHASLLTLRFYSTVFDLMSLYS